MDVPYEGKDKILISLYFLSRSANNNTQLLLLNITALTTPFSLALLSTPRKLESLTLEQSSHAIYNRCDWITNQAFRRITLSTRNIVLKTAEAR